MIHSYLNYTEETKKFEDIPVRGLTFLLKKLRIYELFEKYAQDDRNRKGSYSIASLLMAALEIPLFHSPSKNEFYQYKKLGRGDCYANLGKIAHIEEKRFPHSKTIDDAFLSLNPDDLEPILFDIFKTLHSAKLFFNHPSLKKCQAYRLAIDAFCSRRYHTSSQHPCEACPFCLKRERKTNKGTKVWYVHMEVLASLIFENGFQMPLCVHCIRKKRGWQGLSEEKLKQECEQTAFPYVLAKIRTYLPKLKITVLLDALYANQTTFDTLKHFHFDFDIVLKRLKTVQEEIDSIDSNLRSIVSKRFNLTQTAYFTNNISYGRHCLNAVGFDEYAQKKTSKRFAKINNKKVHYQWIVSKTIDQTNLFSLIEEARSRWRQEDLINSLKNRGFHIKHDYSRHPSCQIVWKILILIAFSLTSIFLLSDIGIKARRGVSFHFLMKQMLQDLFYLSYESLFLCSYPKQLRFSLWMNAG